MRSDDENLLLVDGCEAVDAANREFYGRFPYPWPPETFPRLDDPDFEAMMLNQSVGDFTHRRVPSDGRIWVAGCGTNQAVYTALRFPKASVVGSDLSSTSLEFCRKTAASLGISNLTLRQESLNHVTYREEFDYILSTGVIHHNAEPATVLANLATALRPNGVLELMVYNRFTRLRASAFQKAVRAISRRDGRTATYDEELAIARALVATALADRSQAVWAHNASESELADMLIQPVEYSYTVESLDALANACGLRLLLPCDNQFDGAAGRAWTVRLRTNELQRTVDALPDVVRWQITNLLYLDRSPMLWFFLEHRGPSPDGRYEWQVNEEFLDRPFLKATTSLRHYRRGPGSGRYELMAGTVPHPAVKSGGRIREIVQRADGRRSMRTILSEVGVDVSSPSEVTDVRTQTTTSLCPYLKAA